MQIIRCVLSGSYRRDFQALERDYRELIVSGCQVLSPHRLNFPSPQEEFIKDAAEVEMAAPEIEKHHLLSIRQSDFVWLHCPSGYLGVSAAMEVGYASALGIPIFCKVQPREVIFEQLVLVVPSVFMAIEALKDSSI